MSIKVLSGGAAEGLVAALAPEFKAAAGLGIDATFGAVGAMRDKLLAGADADIVILTRPMIAELERQGHVAADSARVVGVVSTGVAVRSGDAVPSIADARGLCAALLAADAIYFPDPTLATAGIHFAKVLDQLGIAAEVAGRLRPYPNGAAAMAAMAAAEAKRPIGCTQVTEILNTRGVALVGGLPPGLGLDTVYTAAVTARSGQPAAAAELIAALTSASASKLRQRLGFAVGAG